MAPKIKLDNILIMDLKYCKTKFKKIFAEIFCFDEKGDDHCKNITNVVDLLLILFKEMSPYVIPDEVFCIEIDKIFKGINSCEGDLGLPAVINDKLVGIVTYLDYEYNSFPVFYAEIYKLKDWIKNVTSIKI